MLSLVHCFYRTGGYGAFHLNGWENFPVCLPCGDYGAWWGWVGIEIITISDYAGIQKRLIRPVSVVILQPMHLTSLVLSLLQLRGRSPGTVCHLYPVHPQSFPGLHSPWHGRIYLVAFDSVKNYRLWCQQTWWLHPCRLVSLLPESALCFW